MPGERTKEQKQRTEYGVENELRKKMQKSRWMGFLFMVLDYRELGNGTLFVPGINMQTVFG